MDSVLSRLTRRQFVKYLAAGSLSMTVLTKGLAESLIAQEEDSRHKIVWLKGQASGIDSAGMWNHSRFPYFLNRFFNVISQSEMDGPDSPVRESDVESSVILILEGSFSNNPDDPMNALIKDLIVLSRVIILLGNEASYAGFHPDGFLDLEADLLHLVETPYLKIPGAPAKTSHLLGVLNHLVLYGLPELDIYRRPTLYFNESICKRCDYRSEFEAGNFVSYFGEKEGCLYLLGCKGPVTYNNCPVENWNNTSNWCVKAGSPCTGCSEPNYPDHKGLGMFGQLSGKDASINSFLVRHLETIAKGTAAVAVAGIATHVISKKTSSPLKGQRMPVLEEDE